MTVVLMMFIFVALGLVPAAIARNKGHPFLPWWLYGATLFVVALPHAIITDRAAEGIVDRWRTGARRQTEGGKPLPEGISDRDRCERDAEEDGLPALDGWGMAGESKTESDPSPVWDQDFARVSRMGLTPDETVGSPSIGHFRKPFPAAVAVVTGGIVALAVAVIAELPAPTLELDRTDGQGAHRTAAAPPRLDRSPPLPEPERQLSAAALDVPVSVPDRTASPPPPPPPATAVERADVPRHSPGDGNSMDPVQAGPGKSVTAADDSAAMPSGKAGDVGTAFPTPVRDTTRGPTGQNKPPPPAQPRPRQRPVSAESVQAVGETVAWLQRGLRKFGHYDGPIDGRAGALTHQAIRSYQRSRHLTPHGRIDYALLVSLRRSLEGAPDHNAPPGR